MSSRALRKLRGGNKIPEPESSEEESFGPSCVAQSSNKFDILQQESSSESESELENKSDSNSDGPEVKALKQKKKGKEKSLKKKKSAAEVKMGTKVQSTSEDSANTKPKLSCKTINHLLEEDEEKSIFSIQFKYLNPEDEMTRRFGPEPAESRTKWRGRRPFIRTLLKKTSLVSNILSYVPKFTKCGLSMSLDVVGEDGCYYFTFDHDPGYVEIHQRYLQKLDLFQHEPPIFDSSDKYHIQTIVKAAHFQFLMEDYSSAIRLIETAVAYMQYVSHPWFNFANSKVRLLYIFMENRIFHIVLLKYIYLLTNRACHRTALEIAKVLINLDPEDPLAVLLIIDTLALRAKEYEWFIEAMKSLDIKRQAGYLFNIQYSTALAHFHVATKNKAVLTEADKLLQEAIVNYPHVAKTILECTKNTLSPKAQASQLFYTLENKTAKKLRDLIQMYAKLNCDKWRATPVMAWLARNIEELVIQYEQDQLLQERAKVNVRVYYHLFQTYPNAVMRHLVILAPLSKFVCDGAIPVLPEVKDEMNPIPPRDCINRYGHDRFQYHVEPPSHPLYGFIRSLIDYRLAMPERPPNEPLFEFVQLPAGVQNENQNADDEEPQGALGPQ